MLLLNADWSEAKPWIAERLGTDVTVEGVTGCLSHMLVEPFLPHTDEEELYLCIQSNRSGEEILFYHRGGVDIGDVDSKASRLQVGINENIDSSAVETQLLAQLPEKHRGLVASFITGLFDLFRDLHFVYLEINPLVLQAAKGAVVPLDMAAKLDEAAHYLVQEKWGEDLSFPPPFGASMSPEEALIRDLDAKTGASLKLTLLNPAGRVWTMVAGGGASVVYADTIADLGAGLELANYGEYSGAPSEELTYQYAKTILRLMTRGDPREDGKVLIIGGGIANFTDVAKTFKGIIRALKESADALRRHNVRIWVRRGGPNYQEGLEMMKAVGRTIGVYIDVHGPETHITAVVPMALGLPVEDELLGKYELATPALPKQETKAPGESQNGDGAGAGAGAGGAASGATGDEPDGAGSGKATKRSSSTDSHSGAKAAKRRRRSRGKSSDGEAATSEDASWRRFTPDTRCIVYGMQIRAVQGMLDFDYICKRENHSVAALIFPFAGNHYQKFYWGSSEIMVPVFASIKEALEKNPDVTVMVNFASFRSAAPSTFEALEFPQISTIAIIAEGIPEQLTRRIIAAANEKGVMIIGPATVGGIVPGNFRIGNTGGHLDSIIASKLYRPGSIGYVSKSGGMSNELNNICMRNADGVAEGVAIGGDRYPGGTFIDHIRRYQKNPGVKMIVLLGEVGGTDEYAVAEAIRSGEVTKPVVAWCIGTCARYFSFEVQFGHAGALAGSEAQTAVAKNAALKAAGAVVPSNFNDFARCIRETYLKLRSDGTIAELVEPAVPAIPMDYQWAKSLGLIRKPASFVSSISDERGDELLYAGMPITKVFEEDIGIGGVISLLWFRRRMPAYATKFIEMVLMVTADHGPAVSGAHNTIVSARAGKDLVSSLASGLLTIGPRFGGALDDAAKMFSEAYDRGQSPAEFVSSMRRANKLIMGIGHRVKSVNNPDMRVEIVKNFAREHFPGTEVLDFALAVEKVTTRKKANLILNVDGAIACCFVDLLRTSGAFTKEEADETIAHGTLNGLFVLGRSIGFIGHYLDQKRLKQGLYRHPWDDISYLDMASV